MAAILNSAIFDSDTLFSSLRFTQKHSHSTLNLTQTNSISLKPSHLSFSSQTHSHLPRLVPNICTKNFTHSFWLNLMMAAILNSFLLDSSILVFPIKLTHTWLDWSHHWHKKHFTHSSLPTICTKNFTYSFWLNLMMGTILHSSNVNSAILDSGILHKTLNQTHSFSLNLMMAAILNFAVLDSDILHKITFTC